MTIYSLDVLLSQFGTNQLLHVQFWLFLFDLHAGFSGDSKVILKFPCFLYDPMSAGNLISGSFPFLKHSRFLGNIFLYNIRLYFYHQCMHAKSLQLCPTLWDPIDCSPPGSSVHGILQARILEWVTMPFSRGPSRHRDQTHVSYVSCFGRQET